MSITKQNNLKWYQQLFAIFAGACLMGVMWRARGSHGFGAKWGMFAVALVFVMFVYALYGRRKKMNYEMLPLCAVFAALTAGGWGTLNSQMSGYLSSNATFVGETEYRFIEINNYSGIAIMLLLGFGWLPLFAIAFASLFSKKKLEFKDFVIFVGVYYLTVIIANFTISHYVLQLINPEAVEACAEGIKDAGHDYSPMKAFIVKLGSAAWAKKIPFCRNYFTSVKVISSAIGALTSLLTVAIVSKDKVTAAFAFLINTACAVAITVADIPLVLSSDRGILAGVNTPAFLEGCEWSTWEYFTGFILGLLLMALIAAWPKQFTDAEELFTYSPLVKTKKYSLIYNGILTIFFSFVIVPVRAFSFRLNEKILDNDVFETVLTIVLSAALFYPVYKYVTKNMLKKDLDTPVNLKPQDFALRALPVYLLFVFLVYFFLGGQGSNVLVSSKLSELLTAQGFLEKWNSGELFIPLIMLISFIAFNISYKIVIGKKIKE